MNSNGDVGISEESPLKWLYKCATAGICAEDYHMLVQEYLKEKGLLDSFKEWANDRLENDESLKLKFLVGGYLRHAYEAAFKTDLDKRERFRDEVEEVQLPPFRENLKQADVIMTAHLIFSAYDDELPATMSEKTLKGLLRGELGLEGVIMSDAMEMEAIAEKRPC